MLADSQLRAFSVARHLVMFSDVLRTCRHMTCTKHERSHFNITSFQGSEGLTAGEVSSESRVCTALGLFSLQNLQNHTKQRSRNVCFTRNSGSDQHSGQTGFKNIRPEDSSRRLYLVAFGRASNPMAHSSAQMESRSSKCVEFVDFSPSLSFFSPRSTSSFTNVALMSEQEVRFYYKTHLQQVESLCQLTVDCLQNSSNSLLSKQPTEAAGS